MFRAMIVVFLVFSLVIPMAGCGGGDTSEDGNGSTPEPEFLMGVLQFRTRHNLEDDACLPDNCNLSMEDETATDAWLDHLSTISNMAVLHWDRPIPWLVFDADPTPGMDRVDFYDARLDADILAWIDAFVPYFQRMPKGYLAVSILNGERNGLQKCRVDAVNKDIQVTGACPVLSPGTQISFSYDPGTGLVTQSFDLARSYTNFIRYMVQKLQPDYLALMVETNLYKEAADTACQTNWAGLAALYRYVYDAVRPEVDATAKVFATVQLQPLLDYDDTACHGAMTYAACPDTPPAPTNIPDQATCYPLDLSAVHDLDQGDRLEILALSFYPDALLMDVGADHLIKLYPETWNLTDDCIVQAHVHPFLDPVAALDRFNWTKPIAIAELGARGGRTLQYVGGYLAQMPGDLTSQNFWLDHWLTQARERNFEFYVTSFSNDYPPIGHWTVDMSVLDKTTYSLFNNFADMGIYDADGQPKAGVTQTWLDALP